MGYTSPQVPDSYYALWAGEEEEDDLTPEEQDMVDAHGQGHHDDLPREGCPECEDRRNRT